MLLKPQNSHHKPYKHNKHIKTDKHDRINITAYTRYTRCKSIIWSSIQSFNMDVLGYLIEWMEPVIQAIHIVVVQANQIKWTALTIIRKVFY